MHSIQTRPSVKRGLNLYVVWWRSLFVYAVEEGGIVRITYDWLKIRQTIQSFVELGGGTQSARGQQSWLTIHSFLDHAAIRRLVGLYN